MVPTQLDGHVPKDGAGRHLPTIHDTQREMQGETMATLGLAMVSRLLHQNHEQPSQKQRNWTLSKLSTFCTKGPH